MAGEPQVGRYKAEFDVSANVTLSGGVAFNDGDIPCVLEIPSTFVGTAVNVLASNKDGGTYNPVFKDGTAVSYVVADSTNVVLNYQDFAGLRFIKLQSNDTETVDGAIGIWTRRMD